MTLPEISTQNCGSKVKLENAWKDILVKVKYVWMGDKMKKPEEEPCEDTDTIDINSATDDNVDSFLISNLGEKTTRDDIVSILKSVVNYEDLKNFTDRRYW